MSVPSLLASVARRGRPSTVAFLLTMGVVASHADSAEAQADSGAAQADSAVAQAGGDEPFVQISFLDVGQGDAIVIRSPDGQVAMIDAGPGDPLRHLQRMRIDEIDLLVASHPHADHIGGLTDVLTARPVRFYLDNGRTHTTATYARLMATLQRLEGVTVLAPTPRTITLGSVSVRVLPLPPGPGEHNDRSVGLVLEFGAFSAFFSGDSERYELDWWVGLDLVPDVTLLKAPHHGSGNGFTRRFLARARPEVVVISVGANNRYGHPRPEAMTAYGSVAERIQRTDRDGPVTVLGYEDGHYEIVLGSAVVASGSAAVAPGSAAVASGATTTGSGAVEVTPGSTSQTIVIDVVADAPGNDHQQLNGEYAIIANRGALRIAIGNWRLCDLRSRCFRFPPDAQIEAGSQVRVYTGYGNPDGYAFFMNNSRAVWNNDGDEATLYDERGRVVLRYVY
jgi:competence protein ComEC